MAIAVMNLAIDAVWKLVSVVTRGPPGEKIWLQANKQCVIFVIQPYIAVIIYEWEEAGGNPKIAHTQISRTTFLWS